MRFWPTSGIICSLAIFLLPAGCARVIVTRDNGNQTSVKVEPLIGRPNASPPPVQAQTQSIAQMEEAVRNRINQQRRKQGLEPLQKHPALAKIAREYSRRMSRENFFSHTDAQGKSAADRVRAAGVSYRIVGENLFKSINAPDPIEGAVTGWMKSTGHRANILTKNYTHTGVGIWKDGNTYHFTQLFLRPL